MNPPVGNNEERKTMDKKILICAVIALILVPASVMAAGFGGNNTGAASGQGPCLQDGQNCMNQGGQQGSGTQEHYRHGMQQNGVNGATGAQCSGDGPCTHEQKQTGSMLRLHDGTGGACKNSP
ncbi:MAG: hypothetical protein WCB46_03325 [Methanoregula sp.]